MYNRISNTVTLLCGVCVREFPVPAGAPFVICKFITKDLSTIITNNRSAYKHEKQIVYDALLS